MSVRRVVVWLLSTFGALLGLVTIGGGFVYAGQLLPAPSRDRTLDIEAVVTSSDTVILPAERRACLESFGLLLPDGFLRYGGEVRGTCDDVGTVERDVIAIDRGDPQRDVLRGARFDEYIWSMGPDQVGLAPQEVQVQTELGESPAWFLPGDGVKDTWVILVHGRSGTRDEAVRVLPTIQQAGFPSLTITYRNDFAGGIDGPDAIGRFGQDAWPDLTSAIEHALDNGASQVVLFGFSQGGSIIGFHVRERGTEGLAGIVLDSPVLDLPETLVQQAQLRGIPSPLIPPILFGTRWIARIQSGGFDVNDVDHVQTLAAATDVPLLLIHGPSDDFVPVGPSDRLAEARSESLVYDRSDVPGHVEAYNADAEHYSAVVSDFLASLLD